MVFFAICIRVNWVGYSMIYYHVIPFVIFVFYEHCSNSILCNTIYTILNQIRLWLKLSWSFKHLPLCSYLQCAIGPTFYYCT